MLPYVYISEFGEGVILKPTDVSGADLAVTSVALAQTLSCSPVWEEKVGKGQIYWWNLRSSPLPSGVQVILFLGPAWRPKPHFPSLPENKWLFCCGGQRRSSQLYPGKVARKFTELPSSFIVGRQKPRLYVAPSCGPGELEMPVLGAFFSHRKEPGMGMLDRGREGGFLGALCLSPAFS